MSKEQKKREDGFEHLEEALTSGEQFIEKNQKMIVNVVLVLVVIIADISDTTDSLLNHMPKKLPTRFSERKTISKKILSIWP